MTHREKKNRNRWAGHEALPHEREIIAKQQNRTVVLKT